jgi:hypothetical protein
MSISSLYTQLDALLSEDIDSVIKREQTAFDELTMSPSESIVLFGAGGLGRKALAGLRQVGRPPLAFVDNNPELSGKSVDGVLVLSPCEAVRKYGKSVHCAIGNFIYNGLKNKSIMIKGDGSPYRSYLYAADLVIWLWTILFRGKIFRPYNVGSEEGIDILTLANIIAQMFQPELEIRVMQKRVPNRPVERYVPSTHRARNELGVKQVISLQDSIKRTIEWNNY